MKNYSLAAVIAATATLSVSFSTFADSHIAESNIASDSETDGKIIVTGTRSPQSLDSTLAAVEVIDRQTIDQLQPKSVTELLTRLTAVDITRQGGIGQTSSIFVRGDASNHILVLLDGVRVGSATLGYKSLESIPVAQIERIELVRGPRAAIWGSDAMSGVIHIISRRFEQNTLALNIRRGSNRYQSQSLVGAVKTEQFNATLTASYEANEGFDVRDVMIDSDNDGFRQGSVAIHTEYQINNQWSFRVNGQQDKGHTEFDSAFGADESDYNNHQLDANLLLTHEHAIHSLSYATTKDGSELGATFFDTKRQLINYLGSFEISDRLSVTTGADFYTDTVESTTVYDSTERNTSAGFVHIGWANDNLIAEAAIRRDNVEGIDNQSSYNLGLGYDFNDKIRLQLNAGTGFKAPTFNDLYFPASPFSAGNPNLKAETSENVELTAKFSLDNIHFEITRYQNNVDDLIVWQPDQNFFYSPQNVAKAKLQGWELKGDFEFAGLNNSFNMTTVDATDDVTGERLDRRAETIFNYIVSRQSGRWDYDLHLSYHSDRMDTDFDPITFMPVRVKLDAYTLLNATIGFQLTDESRLYINLNNLTDEEYQDVIHYRTAGREFYLGANWRF